MKTRKLRTLLLGTVSHATLRPEDVIPALLDACASLSLRRADRHTVAGIRRRARSARYFASEAASEDWNTLCDVLNGYVPPLCYFGALEGDGSDFGCWPVEIEEVISTGYAVKVDAGDSDADAIRKASTAGADNVYRVTDHGNVTCYSVHQHGRNGHRLRQEWSIV